MAKELTIKRVFDAPRELVFKAWTDPKLVEQWWGPFGVTNPTCEVDARVGGKINIVMLAGQELGDMAGQEWPMTGEFKELVEGEKIVFTGNAIMDGKPILEHLATVTLKDLGDKTEMTLHIEVTMQTPAASGALAGMEMGWNQSLDKLIELLAKK